VQISTSYVERSHLTLRMANERFAPLGLDWRSTRRRARDAAD
jgi:hypothetical protein